MQNTRSNDIETLSQTAPQRIKLALQMQRLKCAELEQKLEEIKLEIQKSSV